MKRGPENEAVKSIIVALSKASSKSGARVWRSVAETLGKPSRSRVEVNVGKINALTKAGDVVLVPGKVLGTGVLEHAVSVGALKFSESAVKKISANGGKCLSLLELSNSNPNGTGVRILG